MLSMEIKTKSSSTSRKKMYDEALKMEMRAKSLVGSILL